MKKATKIIYFSLFFLILFGNIMSVIIFSEYAALSRYSIYPALVMLVATICAILAYDFRHSKTLSIGFLGFGDIEPINMLRYIPKKIENEDFTYSAEFEKEFAFTLFIYCSAIPFTIPIMFFATNTSKSTSATLVMLFPQAVYFVKGTFMHMQDRKKDKIEQKRALIDQEKREELGKWK